MQDSSKMWPYKLMTLFLYSEHDSIHRTGTYELVVQTAELIRGCGINPTRYGEYIQELQDLGLIQQISRKPGYSIIKLKPILSDKG